MIPLSRLPHRLSFRPYLGDGNRGKVLGEPVKDVPARVEMRVKLIRDQQGKEVVSSATIYFQPILAPALGDEVTLPDGVKRQVIARHDNAGRRRTELITVHV